MYLLSYRRSWLGIWYFHTYAYWKTKNKQIWNCHCGKTVASMWRFCKRMCYWLSTDFDYVQCGVYYGSYVQGSYKVHQNLGCNEANHLLSHQQFLSSTVNRNLLQKRLQWSWYCLDALHTKPAHKLVDIMTKSSGDVRMQLLYFLISTAWNNKNTICYEIY